MHPAEGWRERLVPVSNENTTAPGGEPVFTGWCLDPHDLCVAKLCALREKDRAFVGALLEAGLVERRLLRARLRAMDPVHAGAASRATSWLDALDRSA